MEGYYVFTQAQIGYIQFTLEFFFIVMLIHLIAFIYKYYEKKRDNRKDSKGKAC